MTAVTNRFTEPSTLLLIALQSEIRPVEILRLNTGRFVLELSDDVVLVQAFATCISVRDEVISVAGNNKRAAVGRFTGAHAAEFGKSVVSTSWLMQTEVTKNAVIVADSMNELILARMGDDELSFTMPFPDTVNRIRRIENHWWSKLYGDHRLLSGIMPEAYLATVSGGIYLICHFANLDLRRELMNLQFQLEARHCLAINSRVPRAMEVDRYVTRSSASGEFLDGAILDKFLDQTKEEQMSILCDLSADFDYDEIVCVLRALRNLRR
jgi:hypothetical protein